MNDFTPEVRMILSIERAIDKKKSQLSTWELDFLTSLAAVYRKKGSLSVKQKNVAYPILRRVEAWE